MYRNSNLYICSPMKIWRNFSQKYVTLAKLLPNLPNNRYTWGYITYKFDLLSCRKMSIFYIRPFNLQPEKWFWGCHLKFFWVWSWKKKSENLYFLSGWPPEFFFLIYEPDYYHQFDFFWRNYSVKNYISISLKSLTKRE